MTDTPWSEQFAKLLAGLEVKVYKQQTDIIKRIRLELFTFTERFFTSMVSKTFKREDTPGYVSQPWAPLTQKYTAKKGHSRFFEKTGKLAEYIENLSYAEVFGVPKVSPVVVVRGNKDGDLAFLDEFEIRGRAIKRWRLLTRDGRRGRFAKKEDIKFSQLTGTYRIQVFPNLKSGDGDVEKPFLKHLSRKQRVKILNPKGAKRPFVNDYADWWQNQAVRSVVKKYGKVIN